MVTMIDPASCDRTTVFAGECRNFADTEWIRFDSGRRRSPDARDGNTWLVDVAYGSFWMADDKVRNLVHLVPARRVSSDDPATVQRVAHVLRETVEVDWEKRAALILAAVAEQLNASGGYPNLTYWTIRDGQIITDATADDAECELARVKRELAEALGRAKGAESAGEVLLSHKCEMEARVAELEAATAPALSRADIEKAIRVRPWGTGGPDSQGYEILHVESAVDAVCALFGIEAEQAVDPIEALAEELFGVAHPGATWSRMPRGVQRQYRAIAAHVLGQEADQ